MLYNFLTILPLMLSWHQMGVIPSRYQVDNSPRSWNLGGRMNLPPAINVSKVIPPHLFRVLHRPLLLTIMTKIQNKAFWIIESPEIARYLEFLSLRPEVWCQIENAGVKKVAP